MLNEKINTTEILHHSTAGFRWCLNTKGAAHCRSSHLPSVLLSSPSTSKMASLSSSRSLWISCSRAPFLLRMSSSSERSSGLRSTGTGAGGDKEYNHYFCCLRRTKSGQRYDRGEALTMWLFPRRMLAGGHYILCQYCLKTSYNAVNGRKEV